MIKQLLKSRAIKGILVALVGVILKSFGIELPTGSGNQILVEATNLLPEIVTVVGLIIAAYGRIKAKGPITFKKK